MALIRMENIQKQFYGVPVLKNVQLSVKPGTVHALMGENGAGKSTMMKILVGLYRSDGGQIYINDQPVSISSPTAAQENGISMIHQELSPVPELPVSQNIFLGREPGKFGLLDYNRLNEQTTALFKRLNIHHIHPKTKTGKLRIADQQLVEIAKAISLDAQVIIMDEPTSAITNREVESLFAIINDLKKQGKAIIYISHKMDEVFRISDEITVLRDGEYIGTWATSQIDRETVIKNMVGREVTDIFPKITVPIGEVMLDVKGLEKEGYFHDVSFDVRRGEILGIAGLMGAGRSEVMQALFGNLAVDGGEITFEGEPVHINNPQDAMKLGMAFVTEDRKNEGLILEESVAHNITLADLPKFEKLIFLDKTKENQAVDKQIQTLRIKTNGRKQKVESLSGGNQQKVILAKWLMRKPKLLILDEPTRGIDVGAKAEIYKLMGEFVRQGNAIIMISSEMPEVMGLSDRIAIFSNGHIAGELDRHEFSQESIMRYAVSLL